MGILKAQRETIEDLTLKTLQRGPLSAIQIIEEVSSARPGTTRQGVYRVLRKLREEEKIVIYRKSVSLNLHWIRSIGEFFSLAQFYYSKAGSLEGFLNIEDGDRIVYFFKNLNLLDSFWSHALHMFSEIIDPKESIFVYNPHEWFSYARQETEKMLIKTLTEKKRRVFILVTGNYPLDKELKKQFRDGLVQYDITGGRTLSKKNYYFNIIGDYLIEAFIDQKISGRIDSFFKRARVFDKDSQTELSGIIAALGRNKLIISKNKKKAEKYKKLFAKSFFTKRID